MTRKVDFRNHGNIALGSIIHYFLNLLLGIETAIKRAIALGTDTAHRSKFRIFLDFDTPALVFRQMEVHGVHLEHRHQVQLLLHILDRNEMAAWIEMESTVAEAWSILDITALCYPFHPIHPGCALYLGRE